MYPAEDTNEDGVDHELLKEYLASHQQLLHIATDMMGSAWLGTTSLLGCVGRCFDQGRGSSVSGWDISNDHDTNSSAFASLCHESLYLER